MFVIAAGEVRIGVLASGLVVHCGADQGRDHQSAEDERRDAGNRTGKQVSNGGGHVARQ
jgi:hypothetical protein